MRMTCLLLGRTVPWNQIKVCLWEQRLETNNWEKHWFQTFVERVTRNIKKEDYKDEEEFKKEQRECFFNRVDWVVFISAFLILLIGAGASIIDAASKRQ